MGKYNSNNILFEYVCFVNIFSNADDIQYMKAHAFVNMVII